MMQNYFKNIHFSIKEGTDVNTIMGGYDIHPFRGAFLGELNEKTTQ